MSSHFQLLPPNQSVGRIRLGGKLKERAGSWVVWWYGALTKNTSEGTIPLNYVLFRKLEADGTLSGRMRIPVGMTHLGALRVGSVWSSGVVTGHLALPYLPERTVSFNEADWRLVSARELGLVEGLSLDHSDGRCSLIELTCDDGLKILVPCTEFFARGYGRSTETIRTLLRYNWKEAKEHFFFDTERHPDKRLRLKHGVRASEAVFLHHALYDDYTADICQRIYSTLMVGFDNQKSKKGTLPNLETVPWFQGPALIEGRGIWLDEGKAFLMLDLKGLSEPAGNQIIIERQGTAASGSEAGGRTYTQSARDIPVDQEFDLTDAEPPDSNSPTVFYDPPFKRLGEKRPRKTLRRKALGKRGVALKGDNNSQTFSTGEARGKGKGIGKGEGTSPEQTLVGALAQMWKSCVDLRTKYANSITKIEWFTTTDRFVEGGTPSFEPINSHVNSEHLSSEERAWTYLRARKRIFRGALIIRLTCGERTFYVFETQRNGYFSVPENGMPVYKEESYRGLIVELPNQSDVIKTEISLILKKLCTHLGRIRDVPMSTYGHRSFDHDKNSGDIVFENVLLRELNELGMYIERTETPAASSMISSRETESSTPFPQQSHENHRLPQ